MDLVETAVIKLLLGEKVDVRLVGFTRLDGGFHRYRIQYLNRGDGQDKWLAVQRRDRTFDYGYAERALVLRQMQRFFRRKNR